MSKSKSIVISCPACSSTYKLGADSDLPSDFKNNIEIVLNSENSATKLDFHCSACDFSFCADITSAEVISDIPSINDDIKENDIIKEQSPATPEVVRNMFLHNQAEHNQTGHNQTGQEIDNKTQVIDQEIINELREKQNLLLQSDTNLLNTEADRQHDLEQTKESSKIESFKLSSSQQSSGFDPQSEDNHDAASAFYNPAKDYLDDYSLIKPHRTFSNEADSSQTIHQDTPITEEDYSKYAVDNYPDTVHQSDFNFSTIDQNAEEWTDSKTRDSARTIHEPNFGNLFQAGSARDDSSFVDSASGYNISDYKGSSQQSTSATLMLLIAPILLTLAGLSYLTFHIENNLKSADAVLSALFPSSLREPPAGLFILEPAIRPLVLESGDIVNVVQAKIVNKTNKTLSAIQIEGIGFSSNGDLSQKERIMLGNQVSERIVKLKTLTPSIIKEYQNKTVNKPIKLRPNSEKDFILVFTEPVSPRTLEQNSQNTNLLSQDRDLGSYAVRIYAVR